MYSKRETMLKRKKHSERIVFEEKKMIWIHRKIRKYNEANSKINDVKF